MEALNVFILILIMLAVGAFLFYLALLLTEYGTKRKANFEAIVRGFGQKMWMTAGLGLVFFGCYLVLALASSSLKDTQIRLNLFLLMYQSPATFVYLGLLIFACLSTSIYLVRLVIKYLYNTRRY